MNRKPGDWDCRSCAYLNFCRRDSCQRCGASRPSSYGYTNFMATANILPGDWYCCCGIHNYASRPNCFKCHKSKDDAIAAARSSWKFGDWLCTKSGCNEHNYASRMECFKCSTPRGLANQPSYNLN